MSAAVEHVCEPEPHQCSMYTARKWSPLAAEPEDDRCVNCGQTRDAHDERPLMCGVDGCHDGMFSSVEEVVAHEQTHAMAVDPPRRNARRGDRVTTNLRLNPDLHAGLTFAAEERGLTLNYLVERLLTEALDDLIPASEFRLTKRPSVNHNGGDGDG